MLARKHTRRDILRYSALLWAGGALTGLPRAVRAEGSQSSSTVAGQGAPATAVMLDDPTNRQGEYVDLNGARIFYQVTGQGDPLLLIHGYPLSGALFSRVRDMLGMRYQVATIDLRGYGMSIAPSLPDTIGVYADDCLGLLDHLGWNQATVGGMSMGGPITLEMYSRAPERFTGMLLIDTIAAAAKPDEAGLWQGTAEMVRQGGLDAILPSLLKVMLTGATRLHRPEEVDYLTAVVKQASVDGGVGGAIALATRPDYTDLLPRIAVPTLVLVGLDDPLYPFEVAQMMQAAIPGSDLAIIPGGAHAAIFEAPDLAGMAILDWANGGHPNGEYGGMDGGMDGGMEGCDTVEPGGTAFGAQLLPGSEPQPGPMDAFGFVRVVVNPDGQVCYRLSVANLQPTAAHIHQGTAGVAGPVVVPFQISGGLTNMCTMADAALAQAIIADPAGYYVNVHTDAYPTGAIRGQLMPA